MKLTCPKSGIRFTVSCGFGSAKVYHPILHVPIPTLLSSNYPAFIAGKMNPDDTHLFGTALLNQLPVDKWSAPLESAASLNTIWYQTIPKMVELLGRLYERTWKRIPYYRINQDTADLRGLVNYLKSLEECIDKRSFSPIEIAREQAQSFVTNKIYQILRDTDSIIKGRNKLPELVAQWASIAGDFPQSNCQWNSQVMTIREYWKMLIKTAFDPDALKVIKLLEVKSDDKPQVLSDYEELLEHCETEIPFGSLHYDTLQSKLKDTIEVLQEFAPKSKPIDLTVLEDDIQENKVKSNGHHEPVAKPDPEPQRWQYKSNLDYLRARMKWSTSVLEYRNKSKFYPGAPDL